MLDSAGVGYEMWDRVEGVWGWRWVQLVRGIPGWGGFLAWRCLRTIEREAGVVVGSRGVAGGGALRTRPVSMSTISKWERAESRFGDWFWFWFWFWDWDRWRTGLQIVYGLFSRRVVSRVILKGEGAEQLRPVGLERVIVSWLRMILLSSLGGWIGMGMAVNFGAGMGVRLDAEGLLCFCRCFFLRLRIQELWVRW